jgi:amidophosphoribosyltransferase
MNNNSRDLFCKDEIHDECGIVGMVHTEACQQFILTALHALQHRGQESAGVAVSDGEQLKCYKTMGLVASLARKLQPFGGFQGNIGIGHTRYSTTGTSNLLNSQPILINYKDGQLAAAHNGNIINADALRREMENNGSIFQSTNDSEVVLHLIARSRMKTLPARIVDALNQVKGAYSMLFLDNRMIVAARDPFGIRPLCLGKLNNSYVVASETCAFDIIGAEYVREIKPGEVLMIEGGRLESCYLKGRGHNAHCVFEFIYFSRPDSRIFGHNVDKIRRAFGKALAKEHPARADIVISVPDSSNTAALGFSQASGIPFEIGLIRNHYVGRTFINPVQQDRESKVKVKFNPVRGVLKGQRVVVVEDSIVRGTTLRQLVALIRNAGAKEIHIRVSSPQIKFPCYYGMDFPSKEELIANNKSNEQTRKFLGVDSLGHLSIDAMYSCLEGEGADYCYGCFSGKYALSSKFKTHKDILERKTR